jgi:hypothetical protein
MKGAIEAGGVSPVAAHDTVVRVVLAVHVLAVLLALVRLPVGAHRLPGVPPAGRQTNLHAITLDKDIIIVASHGNILPVESRVLVEELMPGVAPFVLFAVLRGREEAQKAVFNATSDDTIEHIDLPHGPGKRRAR